ncbi:MAG: hypothetical protein OSA84_00650 [Akkermansiaceae bacterium]|nr:hypothetical protein [Akkermansiaceae bacterium]
MSDFKGWDWRPFVFIGGWKISLRPDLTIAEAEPAGCGRLALYVEFRARD